MQKKPQRGIVHAIREKSQQITGERYCLGCHAYRKLTAFAAKSRRCDACSESAAARRGESRR